MPYLVRNVICIEIASNYSEMNREKNAIELNREIARLLKSSQPFRGMCTRRHESVSKTEAERRKKAEKREVWLFRVATKHRALHKYMEMLCGEPPECRAEYW